MTLELGNVLDKTQLFDLDMIQSCICKRRRRRRKSIASRLGEDGSCHVRSMYVYTLTRCERERKKVGKLGSWRSTIGLPSSREISPCYDPRVHAKKTSSLTVIIMGLMIY